MSWVELSEVIRNFAIVIGGAFGLWLAWQRSRASNVQAMAARDQATLARRDHVVELFNRAVEQLGHDRLEVRLGAIYTLREIDRDFSDLCGPVFDKSIFGGEPADRYRGNHRVSA